MSVQTPVPIRLPGSFPPNVPQPFGYNSSPLLPPADYYVSRKELLEIAPYLGVMKSVPSAANDTVVLFDDKGQVKSSGIKLSDKADTETVETLVGEDGGKSAREIAKEEVNQLLGEDPNELYDTFTEVSKFIDEAKQNYQTINNALSETAKSLSTKADKTALDTEISRATQSEAQIDGKINTIIADDAGKSARTIAAEEVAKVVADAPADFDTLKEIAEYIESDKTGAAQMVTKIDDNAKAITAETQRAQEAEAALREGKVDAEEGKGLSTNDYTNEDKEKLGTAYTPDNPPPATDMSGYAKTDEVIPRKYEGYWETIVDGMGLHLLRTNGTNSASFTPEGVSIGDTTYQGGQIYHNGQNISLPSVAKDETFAVKSDVENKVEWTESEASAISNIFRADTDLLDCDSVQDVAIRKLSQLLGEDVAGY